MYNITFKTISNFKDVTKYTNSFQAGFDKVACFFSETLPYSWASIEIYFQATMLMNIGSDYLTLVLFKQKYRTDAKTKNLPKTIF